jgi:hypothetical protein
VIAGHDEPLFELARLDERGEDPLGGGVQAAMQGKSPPRPAAPE